IKAGLPTRRIEAWHYTDLRRLLTAAPAHDASLVASAVAPLLSGSVVLPVLNGISGQAVPLDGAEVKRVEDKLIDGTFAPALGAQDDADIIGAINTAFVADGYFLDIAEGAALAAPIELQNVQAGGQTHVRLPVRVGAGAR